MPRLYSDKGRTASIRPWWNSCPTEVWAGAYIAPAKHDAHARDIIDAMLRTLTAGEKLRGLSGSEGPVQSYVALMRLIICWVSGEDAWWL